MAGIEFGLRGLMCFERTKCLIVCSSVCAHECSCAERVHTTKRPPGSLFFALTARARGPGREAHMEMVAFIQTELEGKSVDPKGLIASFGCFSRLFPTFCPTQTFFDRTPRKNLPLLYRRRGHTQE